MARLRQTSGSRVVAEHAGAARLAAHQAVIDRHFAAKAAYWREIYDEPTVFGTIHQERLARALRWIDELPPSGRRALDVGCGTGVLAAQLYRRGFDVDCIDASDEMVALARDQAATLNAGGRMRVWRCDAHELAVPGASVDLVVALGVIPFLHTPSAALLNARRALRRGGHLLVTVDNPFRLTNLVDPRLLPPLAPVRRGLKRLARALGRADVNMTCATHTYRSIAQLLAYAGFVVTRSASLGFGPFTMLLHPVLSERTGIALHHRLQQWADEGVPVLRATGAQFLVLARTRD